MVGSPRRAGASRQVASSQLIARSDASRGYKILAFVSTACGKPGERGQSSARRDAPRGSRACRGWKATAIIAHLVDQGVHIVPVIATIGDGVHQTTAASHEVIERWVRALARDDDVSRPDEQLRGVLEHPIDSLSHHNVGGRDRVVLSEREA
eukprot:scaffold53556_cov32-Tisochrysis_lutea.AAC.4